MDEQDWLSREYPSLAGVITAQTPRVQELFRYSLAQLLVESERARIITAGEGEALVLETADGHRIKIARPPVSEDVLRLAKELVADMLPKQAPVEERRSFKPPRNLLGRLRFHWPRRCNFCVWRTLHRL